MLTCHTGLGKWDYPACHVYVKILNQYWKELDKFVISGHKYQNSMSSDTQYRGNIHIQFIMKRKIIMLVAAAMALTSCVKSPDELAQMATGYAFARPKNKMNVTEAVSVGQWDVPYGLDGPRSIVIDTELQQAHYYIAGRRVGWSTISSGKAGTATPKGTFPIIAKDEDHVSATYGSIVDADGNTLVADYTKGEPIPPGGIYKGAPMTHGMQLTWNGIWMHEGLVTSAPESHGCIRLPKRMAKIFFDNTPVGTPVEIK